MIYEYKCSKCDHVFEVQAKLSDPPPTVCPMLTFHIDQDENYDLERIISQSSFQLKGTGWYTTDYKRKEASK